MFGIHWKNLIEKNLKDQKDIIYTISVVTRFVPTALDFFRFFYFFLSHFFELAQAGTKNRQFLYHAVHKG